MAPESGTDRPSYAILIAISAVGPLALNIFMPSMPGLQREFGVSYGVVQLTLTLYLIGMAACQLVYGPMSDRLGRRPMLLAGMALFVLASVMAALAPSIDVLIAARLLQALGGAAGIVLPAPWCATCSTARPPPASSPTSPWPSWWRRWWRPPSAATSMSMAAGAWASGCSRAGCGRAAAAWFHLPETHVNRTARAAAWASSTGAARLFALPRFRGYTLVLAFTSSVFFAFLGGAPHIMMDVLGRTPMEYGLWFICVSAGYMAGNFLSGRYTRAVGLDRMIMAGCAITLAGGLAVLRRRRHRSPVARDPVPAHVPRGAGQRPHHPQRHGGRHQRRPAPHRRRRRLVRLRQMACGAAASQLVGSPPGRLAHAPSSGSWRRPACWRWQRM